jgi:zinc/manganese transport system substrate-binding protein
MTRVRMPMAVVVTAGCLAAGSTTGCTTATDAGQPGASRVIQVVAAENFWGSIAAQLGGSHVHVVSIITNPDADPHSYEPTAADARTVAGAQLVIENGVGYDPWAAKLVAAGQGQQTMLNVGALARVPDGGNPHRWYNPADVQAVISRLSAEFSRLDPKDKGYFARRLATFTSVGLHRYHSLIASIKAKYAGTPIGASESIFAMLAPALGLKLLTPYSFLKAISEGTEVSAADKQTVDRQISHHLIKIYVYNSQNVTPDVQAQLTAAKAAHIPVATITETLMPPTATYQAWQATELAGVQAALARATGH